MTANEIFEQSQKFSTVEAVVLAEMEFQNELARL